MAESQALLTLGGFVGLLKGIVSGIMALFALCSTVPPNVPTHKLAGDDKWGGREAVREHVGLAATRVKLKAVAAIARRSLAVASASGSAAAPLSSSSSSSSPAQSTGAAAAVCTPAAQRTSASAAAPTSAAGPAATLSLTSVAKPVPPADSRHVAAV